MSAKKVCETKVFEDENTDSGVCSELLSEQLSEDYDYDARDREEAVEEPDHDARKREQPVDDSDKQVVYEGVDSGVDLHLAECLSSVNLDPPVAVPPRIVLPSDKSQEAPPLALLFQQDDDGDTQLHVSAVRGCEKSVGILIRLCPDKSWLDVPNDHGHTALHLAAMSGHAVVARMLVRNGCSLAARDLKGETPLHKAVAGDHLECIQALLSPVAQHPPGRTLATILNQKNYRGQTCVHLAAGAGHVEALQILVHYGADVNAKEGLAGWTALHVAARRGDARLAQLLLQRGAAPAARDYAGRTPRRLARAARLCALLAPAAGDDDSDDDMYDSDSDSENLFEKLRQSSNPINVA